MRFETTGGSQSHLLLFRTGAGNRVWATGSGQGAGGTEQLEHAARL